MAERRLELRPMIIRAPTLMCLLSGLILGGCTKSEEATPRPTETTTPANKSQSPPEPAVIPGLRFQPQPGWIRQDPASSMRAAEYRLPGALETGDDVILVFYFFGQGGANSVESNMERWIGQFTQPDGSPSKDAATVQEFERHGMQINTIDLTGTYVAETRPGSGQRVNEPDFRMLAAIVQTKAGPYYVKMVGPKATVARWADGFEDFLSSLQPAPVGEDSGATTPHP